MITSVVLLQPRSGTPSWGPEDAGAQLPANTVNPAGTDTPGTPVVLSTTVTGISQDSCEKASKSALIVSAGYDFASVLFGVVLFILMKKKLWGTIFSRYMVGVFVASLIAAALVFFDPGKAEELTLCLQSADLARYIWPTGSSVARALVLGLAPTFLVSSLGCFVANRT